MTQPSFGSESLAKGLITVGGILIMIGILILNRDKWPFLRYLGRLPGDFSIQRDNFRIYFPLATSLLVSLLVSLLLWLFRK